MSEMPPIDEKKLVEQLRDPATSRSAFDTVMRLYGERIYMQIRKMVISHDDADDLLQNTFLKAWNNIDNFRGEARLSTWLYKIAVNESINHLNKERKKYQTTSVEDDEFLLNSLESDTFFDGDNLHKEFQKAILMLPEKQRLVFNMKYFQEMKYEDMSAILGTSVGALKASYHHAVKKIEEYFSGSADFPGFE